MELGYASASVGFLSFTPLRNLKIATTQQAAIKNGIAIMNKIANANPTLVEPLNASLQVGHANALAGKHNSSAAKTET